MGANCHGRKLSVLLTLEFRYEDGVWIGICRELQTSTYDKNLSKAKAELSELVALHLNTLKDVGERDLFFKEHGIQVIEDIPKETMVSLPVSSYLQRDQQHVFTESLALPVGADFHLSEERMGRKTPL